MIISHTYKYCFFSVPRTASSAISNYLTIHFNGERRGKRHNSYLQFCETATPEERLYFTFAGVRHPMDSAVSEYFKKKNDHKGKFSRGRLRTGRPIHPEAMERYHYLEKTNADFSDYFLKFYTKPYGIGFHEQTLKYMDFIIKYESLEPDLKHAFSRTGIPTESIELPKVNTTRKSDQGFQSFYSPEALERAREVFGFFMEQYGYDMSVDQ
jgi:hypothetical protein